jgi:D-sedoheptulose 7-phosphate isomerase
VITAYANDFEYDGIFSRQVEAFGQPGDVLIGISTSGSSRNCIQAFTKAAEMGLTTIAMTRLGSQLESMATVSVSVPSTDTQRIQELHVLCFHTICELVEKGFMSRDDQ